MKQNKTSRRAELERESFDLEAIRDAWLRSLAATPIPPPPSFDEINRRAQRIESQLRHERRINRINLAVCLFIGLVVAPVVTASALPVPAQSMNLNHHQDRAEVLDTVNQIVDHL